MVTNKVVKFSVSIISSSLTRSPKSLVANDPCVFLTTVDNEFFAMTYSPNFIFSSSSIFATFSVIFSTVSLSCRFAGFLASSHLNSARYCSVGTPSTVNITCGANASLLLLLFSLLSSRLCRMDSLAMCSPIS